LADMPKESQASWGICKSVPWGVYFRERMCLEAKASLSVSDWMYSAGFGQ